MHVYLVFYIMLLLVWSAATLATCCRPIEARSAIGMARCTATQWTHRCWPVGGLLSTRSWTAQTGMGGSMLSISTILPARASTSASQYGGGNGRTATSAAGGGCRQRGRVSSLEVDRDCFVKNVQICRHYGRWRWQMHYIKGTDLFSRCVHVNMSPSYGTPFRSHSSRPHADLV